MSSQHVLRLLGAELRRLSQALEKVDRGSALEADIRHALRRTQGQVEAWQLEAEDVRHLEVVELQDAVAHLRRDAPSFRQVDIDVGRHPSRLEVEAASDPRSVGAELTASEVADLAFHQARVLLDLLRSPALSEEGRANLQERIQQLLADGTKDLVPPRDET